MKEKQKNKKVVYTIIGIISMLLVAIAITYAYWLITKNQTGENLISSACLDISLTNEENDITLTNQFPLSDEDGAKLTPYTFTVTNNCNTSVDYHINLESIGAESEAIIPSAIKAMLDENTPQVLSSYSEKDITVEGAYEAHLLGAGTLSAKDTEGSSATHSLRLWIDKDAPISEMKKTFTSKISVTIGQGIVNATPLSSLILADAETNNYLYSTTPNFSKVTADGEYGLYSAQDDYGTSYYFRGDVENNYVELGRWKEGTVRYFSDGPNVEYYNTLEECESGNNHNTYGTACIKEGVESGSPMYWRIVRINGNGTIRLVYDGIIAVENDENHNTSIGSTVYNNTSLDIKYVGYTYDDGNGNQVDSTIKGVVDEWYTNNLEQDYGKYIADSIFCNDRDITKTSDNYIYYGAYDRLYTNKSPKLTCTNQSDRYTVEDTTKGNGLLTKPIGLITADEVAMAGGVYQKSNYSYYLYSSDWYGTMSPFVWSGNNAYIWNVVTSPYEDYVDMVDSTGNGSDTRPVINLKADVPFTGSGTIDDPYRLAS